MLNPRYAIVLTHDRPELLEQCMEAIRLQADLTVVIDNASDPPVVDWQIPDVHVIRDPEQPPNLSRLWNIGLDQIASLATADQWDVAVLCDDVVVPEGWYESVSSCMRAHGAAAASTHQWYEVPEPMVKQAPDNDLHNRMCGWAFVVAGEKGLRGDEDLRWWWADTCIDWQARAQGGMVICPGPVAHNIHPNDWTTRIPELNHQSGMDGLTFARKYGGGSRPW